MYFFHFFTEQFVRSHIIVTSNDTTIVSFSNYVNT